MFKRSVRRVQINKAFTPPRFHHGGEAKVGVAGMQGLLNPHDFKKLAERSTQTCKGIIDGLIKDDGLCFSSPLDKLRGLDLISNHVCSVVDAAEFLRNVHFEREFREAAEETFNTMSEFIQKLNANVGLYGVLKQITSDENAMKNFNGEQRRTASLLQLEFERDGIHLSKEKREIVSNLQNEIVRLETIFNSNIVHSGRSAAVSFPLTMMRGVPLHPFPKAESGIIRFPLENNFCNIIMRNAHNPMTRKQVFEASNLAITETNQRVLNDLIKTRHNLAEFLNYESFSCKMAQDKLIDSPEKVLMFLEDLSKSVKEKANKEVQDLIKAKIENEGPNSGPIEMWDLSYYISKLRTETFHLNDGLISHYFTLESVFKGLREICKSLFDIDLIERPMGQSERWDEGAEMEGCAPIKKIEFFHSKDGLLGTVYLDLGKRLGKFPHAAHYTIRCGCSNSIHNQNQADFDESAYQTPIVAVVTSFSLPLTSNGHRSMSHGELETLLHEFGHALHSLLSRTEFQHTSGTRGPIDWVEVPSHLMEHFAWDKRSLPLFSSHFSTGKQIPFDLMKSLQRSKNAFIGLETQQQLLYATVDQKIFGNKPGHVYGIGKHVEEVHKEIMPKVAFVGGGKGAWYNKFSHFTGYGSSYYAYLYDRMLSANIWNNCFNENPLSEGAGNIFRDSILKHGSSKDPSNALREMLNGKELLSDCLVKEWNSDN